MGIYIEGIWQGLGPRMHEEVSVFSYICVCGGCALNLYPVGPFVFVVNWC